MPVAMTVFIPDVMRRLNEVGTSNIATYYSDNSTVDITNEDAITRSFNDAKNQACRTYWPVRGVFTAPFAQAVYAVNYLTFGATPVTGDADYPTPTGSVPWWAFEAKWTPTGGTQTNLRVIDKAVLKANYPNFQTPSDTTQQGAPAYFYRDGVESVGIYPLPNSTAGTLQIDAWRIPEDVTSTGTVAWLSPQEWEGMAVSTAAQVAAKAANDAQMNNRYPALLASRDAVVVAKYASIPDYLKGPKGPFAAPPAMVSQKGA